MSDRLKEIRARLDAATPGPWDTEGPCMSGDGTYGVFADDGAGEPTLALRMSPPDADLVAHAPDDLAWLVAEVERLRKCGTFATQEDPDGTGVWFRVPYNVIAEAGYGK